MSYSGNDITIGDFLSKGQNQVKFTIPPYQRSYSWQEKHVETWWRDIRNTINSERSYFVGPIIYLKNNNNHSLLDGQQRITTTYILYYLMFEIYKTRKENDDEFFTSYMNPIVNDYSSGTPPKKRIILNKYDNKYFELLLNNKLSSFKDKEKESHKNLKNTYTFLKKELDKIWDKDGINGFHAIHNVLNKHFIAMQIEVNDDVDAYNLFESMNDKGLGLSQTDLIKNYIFMKISESISDHTKEEQTRELNELTDTWGEILGDVKLAKYNFDTFLMYYWDANYSQIRKHQVYQSFKTGAYSAEKVKSEIAKLLESSRALHMIIRPTTYDQDDWEAQSSAEYREICEVLTDINSFGIKQFHILLLKLVAFFGIDEDIGVNQNQTLLLPYLKKIRSFIFKYSTVSGLPGNRVLDPLCNIAQKITKDYEQNGETPKLEDFEKEFNSLAPTEDEFDSKFLYYNSTAKVSRRILKSIYPAPSGYNYENDSVDLEHILPKAWDKDNDWIEVFNNELTKYNENLPFNEGKDRKEFSKMIINSIGNHTLLLKKDNIKVSNKSFDIKKSKYKESSFEHTRDLCLFEKFSIDLVNKRTLDIRKKIKHEWDLY